MLVYWRANGTGWNWELAGWRSDYWMELEDTGSGNWRRLEMSENSWSFVRGGFRQAFQVWLKRQ